MSEFFESLKVLLANAIIEENQDRLIHEILTPLSTHLSEYLGNPENSYLSKLILVLTIFPRLKQFMETSSLLRDILFRVGDQANLELICREIYFHATSFPELIDQSAYTDALLKFPFSGFPHLLADLLLFLKANLLVKYETLKKEASKAAAAAEKAKDELAKAAFRTAFTKYWAKIPAEQLPALKEGMRLRGEWWNGSSSSKTTLTKEQLDLLKSYDEFTSFVRLKMNGK